MQKELMTLAKKMQVLKKEDKVYFLRRMRECATLFDPKEPKDIPSCSVDERKGYKIHLIRSLYRKLEGERHGKPTAVARALANTEELKKMNEQEMRQRVISDGIYAYCNTDEQDKNHFEHIVLKTRWMATFLRKRDHVLDYDFR